MSHRIWLYIGNYDDFRMKIVSSLNFTINGNIFIRYRIIVASVIIVRFIFSYFRASWRISYFFKQKCYFIFLNQQF